MIANEAEIRMLLGLHDTITDEERGVLNLVHTAAEGLLKKVIGYDPEQQTHTNKYYPLQAAGVHARTAVTWDVNTAHTRAIAELTRTDAHRELQLADVPLRSISSLRVDSDGHFGTTSGAFAAESAWTEGEDYWPEWEQDGLCSSGILIASGNWPQTPGSVRATYVAGYTADELSGDTSDSEDLVDASGLKRCVILTVTKGFQTWAALKKKTGAGFTAGPLSSEKLGDYGYTIGGMAAVNLAGLVVAMPAEAYQEAEPFIHYGLVGL